MFHGTPTLITALLVTLLLVRNAYPQSPSPPVSLCPAVFGYEWDAEDEGWLGVITIVPPILFKEAVVEVTTMLVFYRKNAGDGSIELDGDTDEISKWVFARQRRPVRFRVTFPPYATLPILKSIKINGKEFCPNLPDAEKIVHRIKLMYTLKTGASGDGEFQTLPDFQRSPQQTTRPSITAERIPMPPPSACGQAYSPPRAVPLIVGGSDTEPGDWPWHVAMYYVGTGVPEYICGATLVSLAAVVTAAHCVTVKVTNQPVRAATRRLYCGKYRSDWGAESDSQESGVRDIIVHPDYNANDFQSDIAVLTLATPVRYTNFVRPICLWSGPIDVRYVENKKGTVVGWGKNGPGGRKPELMSAKLPIVPKEKCIESSKEFYLHFTSYRSFCVGLGEESKLIINVCEGDSGGGLYLPSEAKDPRVRHTVTWSLRGIVSTSPRGTEQNCDPSQYSVFTDVAQYLPFLRSVIR